MKHGSTLNGKYGKLTVRFEHLNHPSDMGVSNGGGNPVDHPGPDANVAEQPSAPTEVKPTLPLEEQVTSVAGEATTKASMLLYVGVLFTMVTLFSDSIP